MFKIAHKQIIAQGIKRIDIIAPVIAGKILPGQFVMLTPTDKTQPMPMTVVDADPHKGVISFIVHEVGSSTKILGEIAIGQSVFKLVGPLGRPAVIEKYGLVICVATGIGAAQILPICRALKKKGNKVIGIIGAKSKKVLMLESQMRVVCDDLFITTNDGSYERKGLASQLVQELSGKYKVNAIYAIGSVEMMKAASMIAQKMNIPVRVTVSPYMASGVGTCGSCRVRVGEQFRLACIEGPEFNGFDVDFDDLEKRDQAIKEKAWDNTIHPVSPKSGGFTTLVKSFWGSARNKT